MPEYVSPGVFVEEAPAGARPIDGVGTSTTAFVGATPSVPDGSPLMVHSFAEYEAQFGALAVEMPLGHVVQHFFLTAAARRGSGALCRLDRRSPMPRSQCRRQRCCH